MTKTCSQVKVLLAISGCLMLASDSYAASSSQTGKDSANDLYKLNATITELGKKGVYDTPYRYLTKQGIKAYNAKQYPQAEILFSAALKDAEKQNVGGENMAVILTNLAGALRDEKKYSEAEPIFTRALAIKVKRASGLSLPLPYTLIQYAALLRKTGHGLEASSAEQESAENYKPAPALAGKISTDKLEEETATQERSEQARPKEQSESTSGQPEIPQQQPQVAPKESPKKSITIRLVSYSLSGGQLPFEALRTAAIMQSQGTEVTLLLDREGVMLLHKNIQEQMMVNGRFVYVRDAIAKFIASGGTVIANKRYLDDYQIQPGNIQNGVKVISEEEMASEYVSRQSNILDF